MKKIILPVALIAGLLIFCTISVKHTVDISSDVSELLERAQWYAELGDYDRAESLSIDSQTLWQSHEGFLGMVLRHTESDDIDCLYPPLLDACRAENAEEYSRRNHELQAYLRQLSRMEIPYFFNVL